MKMEVVVGEQWAFLGLSKRFGRRLGSARSVVHVHPHYVDFSNLRADARLAPPSRSVAPRSAPSRGTALSLIG